VFVRNGTAVIGGFSYGAKTLVFRVFHSGSWSNVYYLDYVTIDSNFQTKINLSTNVNTDQASNSKYPSVKAVFDWATNLFFPKPTGTTAQYLRGDGTVATFPTIPDPSDFVEKSDFTSHSILAKQSGAGDPVAVSIGNNEFLGRKSGGGSNIEGLSVSEVKSILSYSLADLDLYIFKSLTSGATVTGTAENIVGSFDVGSSKFSAEDNFNFDCDFVRGTRTGNCTLRAYLAPNSNNLTGAVRIALGTTMNNTVGYIPNFIRSLKIKGGNLEGFQFSRGTNNQNLVEAVVNYASTPFDVTSISYLIITSTFTSADDTGYLNSMTIKNF